MRKRIFIALCGNLVGAVALALVLTWAVGAQGPEPREREPHRGPHPVYPTGVRLNEKPAPRLVPSGGPGAQNASAAVALGQPGTVFRYTGTLGVLETPYFSDTTHINRPMGLFMDGSDNLYVTEEQGRRLLKYNSSGGAVLALGKAGVSYVDDYVFGYPMDVAVDGDSNIWVTDDSRVVQYTPGGVISQSIPARDDDPWRWEDDGDPADDNTRFSGVRGVAFDSAGRMFVADTYNYRVQVYTFVGGSPVYSATVGEKDVAGSDNAHFDEPQRLAVDGSDRLYVVDRNNNRVQRCAFSGGSWTCAAFDSGLNYPNGIAIRGDNVYIADTYNGRIRRCSVTSGACSDFVTDTYGMYDVAVDSSGNVYGSAAWEAIVAEFDSSGNPQGAFLGVEGVPYLTDGYHYNHPRIAIDKSNNIIIVEENGQRLLKLNSSGVPQWAVGVPGVDTNSDNDHFNWPHGVATDNSGNIYVADGCRVQIFNSNGVHSATLGGPDCGNGTYEFDWATGIAVDNNNGNIYVSDGNNHRVQVYNSSRVFVTTIGATGQCGTANNRFCTPLGVDIDAAGNIYVADGGNCRVQKFNSSRVYQMTLGETGNCGDSFSQFSWPEDVAVDGQGRIYVADWDNQRVQVFDSSGAYLTTIGGEWGDTTSRFRGVSSVDLDSAGNVYVTDWENARIQKFAPDVPGWRQVNINGFGNRSNWGVASLAFFGDTLYAGTLNLDTGGEVWRMGSPWTAVITGGLGSTYNWAIDHLVEFKGDLYAGTFADETNGGEVWHYDGLGWTQVVSGGFGDTDNFRVFLFAVFSDTLYASTFNQTDGGEIWYSSSGDVGTWNNANVPWDTDNQCAGALEAFNGYLYVGTLNWDTGGEIWRTPDGTTWTQVNTDGFGDGDNDAIASFAVFNGYLYAGTMHDSTGGQVWRCSDVSGCDDNSDWVQVVSDGFGSTDNYGAYALIASDNELYCATRNDETGGEVWRSSTGDSGDWEQVGPDGFGDSNNYGPYWNNSVAAGSLYIGTWNWANGGEVWQLAGGGVYLPIILKSFSP